MHKLKLKRAKTKSNHIYTPKTNARKKHPATNRFLQIATCSDLITRLARRARRKRNLRRILISFLKTVNPRRSSQTVSARFYHNALQGIGMKKAYFISSIVNMENLILNLMPQANASEEELRDKGELSTKFGEKLSWRYLCYVREHPTFWTVPTHILYGKKDRPSSFETICEFAQIRSAQCLPSEKRGASVSHG